MVVFYSIKQLRTLLRTEKKNSNLVAFYAKFETWHRRGEKKKKNLVCNLVWCAIHFLRTSFLGEQSWCCWNDQGHVMKASALKYFREIYSQPCYTLSPWRFNDFKNDRLACMIWNTRSINATCVSVISQVMWCSCIKTELLTWPIGLWSLKQDQAEPDVNIPPV